MFWNLQMQTGDASFGEEQSVRVRQCQGNCQANMEETCTNMPSPLLR